MAKDHLSNI